MTWKIKYKFANKDKKAKHSNFYKYLLLNLKISNYYNSPFHFITAFSINYTDINKFWVADDSIIFHSFKKVLVRVLLFLIF